MRPPLMERNDNLPKRSASSSLARRVAAGGANLTSSSSSSSYSSSASPPDFLRQVHSVLNHRRPLGSRAVRVLDPQRKPSKSSAFAPPLIESNAGKAVGRALVSAGAAGVRNEGSAEMGKNPTNDSSLTPPSVTSTVTDVHEENLKSDQPGTQNEDSEMLGVGEKATLALAAFPTPLELESNVVPESDGLKKVQAPPALSAKPTSHKDEGISGNRITVYEQDYRQQGVQNMEMSSSGMPFAGNLEREKEHSHSQHRFQPETRSTLVCSSHVTTNAVHSDPIFQSAHAPSAGQGEFTTQIVSSATENQIGIRDHAHPNGQRTMATEGSLMQEKQGHHNQEDIRSREIAENAGLLQSQASSTSNSSAKADMKTPKTSKAEKMNRRKKYDSDVFFKVNGKLYQKLGKIGSGGSSEVHKVISADCTIYALKKIKLKGRDYATAYGFCQEIGYLNKLKGKNNIIQLIDYEVTDKTLLQQAMEEFTTSRDGRIKDDQYIYMVLEYGEIDLAHMLLLKWENMDSSSWKIDENWLRFYWQQMLEAVNTIHEERIVHSDLKPANFLLVRGSLKLIDFGIAKAIMSDTTNIQRDAQVGTLNYMSPEAFMWNEQDQTGGTIKCGRPSDIWSLGCILYQMVYGKPPFANYKTFWAKFKVITDENHEIAYEPTTNPWLVDLMKRCLAWDRSRRWRISQLLKHPFLAPPLPQEQPSPEDHPCKMLFHRVELFWNEPEISRLCSELHCAISRLEKACSRKY